MPRVPNLNHPTPTYLAPATQVFPWVIADYTSRTLDLTDPATFRDLTRPIGALNGERLRAFRERYVELKKLGTVRSEYGLGMACCGVNGWTVVGGQMGCMGKEGGSD